MTGSGSWKDGPKIVGGERLSLEIYRGVIGDRWTLWNGGRWEVQASKTGRRWEAETPATYP